MYYTVVCCSRSKKGGGQHTREQVRTLATPKDPKVGHNI